MHVGGKYMHVGVIEKLLIVANWQPLRYYG